MTAELLWDRRWKYQYATAPTTAMTTTMMISRFRFFTDISPDDSPARL
jgi:hypothetical protein